MSGYRETGSYEFLQSLNSQQRQAVTHGESPLLIVAGAGTGKTTTLAHRVAWQVLCGVHPDRILLLTFSRRAAAEMLRRVAAILSQIDPQSVEDASVLDRAATRRISGGTFHSVAANLLRQHGSLIGLTPDFTILDRSDAEDLMNLARAKLNLPKTPRGTKSKERFPLKATCIDIYSRCVNTQQSLDLVLEKTFPWCLPYRDRLAELFASYATLKEQQRLLDFDDLLLFWLALVQDATGGQVVRERFDRVLVDEYQDTNVLQAAILKHLVPDGLGLTAVGDDAQSIYSFRAATVRNILDFPQQFEGTRVVALEQNYRSVDPILRLTNAVIAQAAERHHKNLWSERGAGMQPQLVTCSDEDAQTDFLIDTILQRREQGTVLREQAVLFRASHHCMSLEAELTRRGIPFQKYGGLRFLETAHVKDLVAFLKFAENPFDSVSGFRILTLLPGIGQVKAGNLLEQLNQSGGRFDAWSDWNVPTPLRDLWPAFLQLLTALSQDKPRSQISLTAEIHAVRQFYTPLLEGKYENTRARIADLKQMEVIAARYATRRDFLAEMTLDPPSSTQDLAAATSSDDDYLILSTIHSAKGLEWDTVYVIHASDGNIPADQATGTDEEIEEERRLFYVALTRAKNHLFICRPERYFFRNRRYSDMGSLSQITRFLPASVQKLCQLQTYGDVIGDAADAAEIDGLISDTTEIRNRLNRFWS